METLLHQQMEQFRIHKPRMQKIFALYRDIRRLIGQCPIGQIQVIWCVSSSPHPVYEITTSRGVYMFGALSHKYEFLPDQRRFIVSLMRRTQKQNLPFATPKLEANPAVQNPECETDRYVFRFQGKDYILQKKLTGVQKSFAHAQRADFYEVGYAAGQLHSAWRNVQLEGKRGRAVDLTESMKVLAARIPQWDTLVMRLKTKQDQAEGLTPAEQFFLTNQEGLRTFFSKWVFFISSRIPQLSPSWQEGVRFSDLRFGNLLFDKEGKKVAGIFDFEMADRNVRILEFHNMLLGVGKDEFPWYDANAQEAVIEGYQCAATPLGSALNEAEIQGIKEVVIPWRILMEIDKAFFAPDHPKHLFSHPNMLSQFIRLWESVQQLTPIPQKQTNGHQPSGKISGVFSFSHISDQVSRAG